VLVPLDRVLFGVNPPAGMNFAQLGGIAYEFRRAAEPCDPPILVTSEWVQVFRVHDGRHRVFGSIIAGRSHIEAQLLQEKP
jgi:hypothetical protein